MRHFIYYRPYLFECTQLRSASFLGAAMSDLQRQKKNKTPQQNFHAPVPDGAQVVPLPANETVQRAQMDAQRLTPADVSALQRSMGNAAVAGLLKTSQPAPAPIQRKAIGVEGGALDGDMEGRLRQSQSGGSSLPKSVRSAIEPKLGADLGQVKVHTDSHAVQLSQEMGAKAFTHKNHIYYGKGHSPNDLKLTAHEAVHTVQQGAVSQKPQRKAKEEK